MRAVTMARPIGRHTPLLAALTTMLAPRSAHLASKEAVGLRLRRSVVIEVLVGGAFSSIGECGRGSWCQCKYGPVGAVRTAEANLGVKRA